MKIRVLGVLMLCVSTFCGADDNLLAHRLFEQGDYARASELFTDPAWKGVALYRSSQWWRAAEAFVRANDAPSAYNLGNCYVKLGYYELALEAYLQALALDPSLQNAQYNAEIMRTLLAREDKDKQGGSRQPSGEEIEKLETDTKPNNPGSGQEGSEENEAEENSKGKSDQPGEQAMGPQADAQPGSGGEAANDSLQSEQQQGHGAVSGTSDKKPPSSQPSGGSENDTLVNESQASGLRTELETEQATTQWLNRIQHDSQLYLQRRIQLELRRRLAAGQPAPVGGSGW